MKIIKTDVYTKSHIYEGFVRNYFIWTETLLKQYIRRIILEIKTLDNDPNKRMVLECDCLKYIEAKPK